MKYGILGYGVVGKATHLGILNMCEISIHDKNLETEISSVAECDCVFFCIPTDDQKDVDNLIYEIKKVKEINPKTLIVIRSTVPIGTCCRIEEELKEKIIYIPEFLRERVWEDDCKNRPLIVGHTGLDIPEWLSGQDIIECSLDDAELLKMFWNNLSAIRVVFANHLYDVSKKSGADYNRVLDMYAVLDNPQSYLEANENLRGFGGKCLPKDLDFLIKTITDFGLDQTLFDAVKRDNAQWKITVRKS